MTSFGVRGGRLEGLGRERWGGVDMYDRGGKAGVCILDSTAQGRGWWYWWKVATRVSRQLRISSCCYGIN